MPKRLLRVAADPFAGYPPGSMTMKGVSVDDPPPSGRGHREWLADPKMDGHRFLLRVTKGGVTLFTGGGVDKTILAPHIAEAAADIPPGTWLDGEICALGGSTEGWGITQSVMGSGSLSDRYTEVKFVAFDILAFAGENLTNEPLHARKEKLRAALVYADLGPIEEIVSMPGTPASVKRIMNLGFEGVMCKYLDWRYDLGRKTTGWLKIKRKKTYDAFITGYKPGEAGLEGLIGSIIFSQYEDGREVEVGKCSGMSMAVRRDITAHQDEYLRRCFEFGCNDRMPTGGFRSPQWKRWRDDKRPEDCIADHHAH